MTEPPTTLDEFVEDVEEDRGSGRGKYGYCLRGGPGASNGWMMFMLTHDAAPTPSSTRTAPRP